MEMNPDAIEFVPQDSSKEFRKRKNQMKGKPKEYTLSDLYLEHLSLKQKPKRAPKPPRQAPKNPQDQMIKARIYSEGQILSVRISKKDLKSGKYQVLPRKPTRLKKLIKEQRNTEGRDTKVIPKEFWVREYVDQVLSLKLDNIIEELLTTIFYFYKRKKEQKPHAKVPKRFVKGLNESLKYLDKDRAKCVVIAPNIEKVSVEGGLDELVVRVVAKAAEKGVPVVFGLDMSLLGKILVNKAVSLAAVAVLDYSGAEALFRKTIEELNLHRRNFQGVAYDSYTYYHFS